MKPELEKFIEGLIMKKDVIETLEDVLEQAKDLQDVIVLATRRDGVVLYYDSGVDLRSILWMMEGVKYKILSNGLDQFSFDDIGQEDDV